MEHREQESGPKMRMNRSGWLGRGCMIRVLPLQLTVSYTDEESTRSKEVIFTIPY
jgi:hypothetical protein